jgi:hypothetical protein
MDGNDGPRRYFKIQGWIEVNTALIEILVGVNIFVQLWAFEEKVGEERIW